MAKQKPAFDTPFRKGDKVTATVALLGVPEGTSGTVKLINGFNWTRYWVFFDNGIDLGSIDQKALVRTKQWADYQVERERLAARAAEQATVVEEKPPTDTPTESPAASRVPAALLERAKKRREALEAG